MAKSRGLRSSGAATLASNMTAETPGDTRFFRIHPPSGVSVGAQLVVRLRIRKAGQTNLPKFCRILNRLMNATAYEEDPWQLEALRCQA